MDALLSSKSGEFFKYLGLAVFGYVVLKYALKITRNLYTFTLGGINLKKYGEWAVVTGCTDGIGKAYAEKLAKKGLNIVLLSRSVDKLNELAKELEEKYKVKTKVITADFTVENTIYDNIQKQLEGLNVGVLINNVGMSYSHPEFFAEIPNVNDQINNVLHCNIVSVTKMTAIVLPGMVKRGGGVIVNNASSSGRFPTPLLSIYSATKAYMDFFSRALAVEYKSKGIIVQSLCPFFVSTKLAKVRKSLTAPSPNEFVNSAIKTIGSQEVTNGCMVHNIQGWLLEEILPEPVRNHFIMKGMLGARKSALRKLNNNKKE